jgi:hypothetical protein
MTDLPANKRGWGWPGAPNSAEDKAYRASHIVALEVQGVNLYVRKEVARLFKGFIDELCRTKGRNGRLYRLDVNPDDWGYANRDVRGRPGVKSNHAWGLAVDLNSATNPMTEDGRTHTDLPSNVGTLASKWGLRWGGDYDGDRRDPMHFEFMGTPSDASRLIKQLLSSPPGAGQTSHIDDSELDVDETTLRKIIGEEVDKRIRLVLIGDVVGEVGDQHPNNLEQVRKDIADLKSALT